MADQLSLRGGTTTEHGSFTGANKEVTVDTTKKTLVVHDGATVGGHPIMRENGTNSALALGSAATPSLKFTGDTNTGIYSPGADQVAISTNGTGRLFVNASGNIEIQSTSTGTPFYVNKATSEGLVAVFDSAGASTRSLEISSFTTSVAGAGWNRNAESSAGAHSWSVAGSERMRLTSAGLLGLGTSSPGRNLDITSSDTWIRTARTSGNAWLIGPGVQDAFRIYDDTAGVERFRIEATTGNVGIGTTSPNGRLDVVGGTIEFDPGVGADSTRAFNFNIGTTNFAKLLVPAGSGGALAIHTGGPGAVTERARIDSSGRLLVGTSSESAGVAASFQGSSSSASGPGIVSIKTGTTNPTSGNVLGYLQFRDAASQNGAQIIAVADGNWATGDGPTRLVFSTTADGAASPTERMRISNDGLIATFATTSALIAASAEAAGTTHYTFVGRRSATSTQTGVTTFGVFTNGDVVNTNNSYGAISDIKLKENIVDANSQWDDLKAFQVRKYNFKEGQTHTQIGLVAQEVELVSPGLVNESPDRDEDGNDLGTVTKSVNYSVLYMKAVKALQEAMERIEVLEQRLSDAGIA